MAIGNSLDNEIKYGSFDPDFNLEILYEWLKTENREPAQTKFTAGLLRNVAKEIEYLLNEKSDGKKS